MNPLDAPLHPRAGTEGAAATAWRGGAAQPTHEAVVQELPVALEFNGIAHAVMLVTPLDLEDFALGFALTEGLIDHAAELLALESEAQPNGVVLKLRVTARCEARLRQRRRFMAGRTGCGLCGVERLDEALPPSTVRVAAVTLEARALQRAMAELAGRQPIQQATGAAHAAAWCGFDGAVQVVREDVGRHNALDKLIGALLHQRVDSGSGWVAVTSRASVEMVQKVVRFRAGALAAVSAPTQLAIDQARAAGLLLAGFVRDDRATIYSGSERVTEPKD